MVDFKHHRNTAWENELSLLQNFKIFCVFTSLGMVQRRLVARPGKGKPI